jgi:hypothetical protein
MPPEWGQNKDVQYPHADVSKAFTRDRHLSI